MIELAFAVTLAASNHAENHDWYKGKKIPGSIASCCNKKDCRRVSTYQLVPGGARFRLKNRWVFVPDRLIKYETPDGEPHFCGTVAYDGRDVPRCGFIPPGQV